jgi:hypothetical protein
MTTEDDGFDARQAARDELAPDGRTLALMLENIVAEAAQIRYIRGKLKGDGRLPEGPKWAHSGGVAPRQWRCHGPRRSRPQWLQASHLLREVSRDE